MQPIPVSRTALDDVPRAALDLELAIEEVAEARVYLIDLDRKQNQLREAKRHLLKHPTLDLREVWMLSSASTFVSCEQLPRSSTIQYLEWQTQEVQAAIEKGREALKEKVAHLVELEGPDGALRHLHEGFDLKSVNQG